MPRKELGTPHVSATQTSGMLENERFRSIRINIKAVAEERRMKTILITSAAANEGKTHIAVNLSRTFAMSGTRVLLIDANIRDPHLHRYGDLENRDGLAQLLTEHATLEQCFQEYPNVPNLTVITGGTFDMQAEELLGGYRFRTLLNEVKGLFDIVIIDSPAVMNAASSLDISVEADGTVVVVNVRRTKVREVKRALRQLQKVNANVIGLVLNRVSKRTGKREVAFTVPPEPVSASV